MTDRKQIGARPAGPPQGAGAPSCPDGSTPSKSEGLPSELYPQPLPDEPRGLEDGAICPKLEDHALAMVFRLQAQIEQHRGEFKEWRQVSTADRADMRRLLERHTRDEKPRLAAIQTRVNVITALMISVGLFAAGRPGRPAPHRRDGGPRRRARLRRHRHPGRRRHTLSLPARPAAVPPAGQRAKNKPDSSGRDASQP